MSHEHLTEIAIAEVLLGAEPAGDAAACPVCRAALDDARREATAFTRTVGPRTLPVIEARLARWRMVWFASAGLAAVAAVAAVALVWFAGRAITAPGIAPRAPMIAAKGDPALHVMARQHTGGEDHVFEVQDGAALRPGDAIRFAIDADGGYLLVVSVDGAGQLSVYHPYGGDRSAPLDAPGHRAVLDGSIVLDDAPGPERIWAVISDRPIAVAELRAQLAAIQAGGPSAIRRGVEIRIAGARQASLWFEKPTLASPERTP